MASRLVGFHSSLLKTEKTVVNLLAYLSQKDCRTVHGSNLKRISNECDVSIGDLNCIIVNNTLRYSKVPEEELWRLPVIKELLSVKF